MTDRQTDRLTDRQQRIRAHRALAQVGSKSTGLSFALYFAGEKKIKVNIFSLWAYNLVSRFSYSIWGLVMKMNQLRTLYLSL